MKSKIVIIGANEFQRPLIRKAKELGYETHVFAWRDGAVGAADADVFYPISITEKDEILRICRDIKPEGVVSVGSDLAVCTVNYIAEKLGLNGNSIKSIEKSTNKYVMRKEFERNGISVPHYQSVGHYSEVELDKLKFPVIVKPTDRSGSRSITKLYDATKLKEAIETAVEVSFEKKAIIEEFIEGQEYSCECISYKGKHHMLALTKKYTTGEPNYIETGHMQPAKISDKYIPMIKDNIFKALDAIGVENGASHSEFKIDNSGNIGIIEIGARMGGDCIGSDLVYLSTGYDFLKMVIDVACGREPQFIKMRKPSIAKIQFLFNEADIAKMQMIQKDKEMYFVSDINYENIGNVKDSSTRLGYYIWIEKERAE